MPHMSEFDQMNIDKLVLLAFIRMHANTNMPTHACSAYVELCSSTYMLYINFDNSLARICKLS